jgi:hypothetical protein
MNINSVFESSCYNILKNVELLNIMHINHIITSNYINIKSRISYPIKSSTQHLTFFRISPSLKHQEGPMSPLLSCLGKWFFLVFEEIRSLLTTNVSLYFDDMCLHKEDETFLNICMGSSKWAILRCSQYMSS